MKKILISFLLSLSICIIYAQNDTMYVYKNGTAVGKYSVTVIDSIIFYQPTISESLNMIYSEQDLEDMRIKSGIGYTKDVFNLMKTKADQYLNITTNPYNNFKPGSDAISGRALQIHVLLSAFTGLILEDERYINKAIEILCAAAQNTTVQDAVSMNDALAVSDAAYAYVIGYECLYPYMTTEQKALIIAEINEYGTWLYSKSSVSPWGAASNNRRAWNWNAVTHGALGLCGLTMKQQQWLDRAIGRCIDYMKYAVDNTGAPHEGIYYMCHGLHFVIPFAKSLKRMTGTDIIPAAGAGVLNIPDFTMQRMYPWGGNTISINQDGGLEPAEGVFYLLSRNNDQTALWAWLKTVGKEGNGTFGQRNWLGIGACLPFILLWADNSLEPISPAVAEKPLSVFHTKGDVTARTGWGESDCLLTFNCGSRYSSIWNHADAGSVTFAGKGDIFITDLGPGNSSTSVKVSSKYHNVVLIDGVGQSKVYANGNDYGNIHSTAYSSSRMTETEKTNSVYTKGNLTTAYSVAHTSFNHAYRQVFLKRTPYPYLIVVDDVKKDTESHTYLTQFFTPSTNSVIIDNNAKTATITGSRNNSKCLAVFFSPSGTLTVAEDNSTGNKAIGASVQAVSAKIVSVFYPFEQNGTPPNISISGTNDNITVSFLFEDNTTESVNITPDNIQ